MSRPGARPESGRPRVIVVGAGFAGLAAVAELARTGAQVTLIDRNVYSTFQPLLYQVATAGLNPGDVAYPARTFTYKRGVRFRLGELTRIDSAARRITLVDGAQFGYDYLVLAIGVTAAYYGVPGAAEQTLGLYTRKDAITLRDHIIARLERIDIAPGQDVNFTVVGGGATGVELAGSLAELRSTALGVAYPGIAESRVHIRLVEQFPALLAPFKPPLQQYAYRQLQARGVDVRLNTKIREVTPGSVLLENGEDLPSDVTVWAAGVAAPDVVAEWGLARGRGGRIRVRPDLRAVDQDRIFAVGDIALIDEQPLPQLAQPAIQTARHAARAAPPCPGAIPATVAPRRRRKATGAPRTGRSHGGAPGGQRATEAALTQATNNRKRPVRPLRHIPKRPPAVIMGLVGAAAHQTHDHGSPLSPARCSAATPLSP